MRTAPSEFVPGKVICESPDQGKSLTLFDPATSEVVESSVLGSARTAELSCVVKTPVGTTGIQVHQCTVSTQFSNMDKDRKLQRHRLTLTLVYPFLGEPHASAELALLARDSNNALYQKQVKHYTQDDINCRSENKPGR